MSDSEALELSCELLADRYGDLGVEAAKLLRHWLSGNVPYAYPEVIEQQLKPEHIDLLFDAFWQDLPFGTGGRRGRVGYGPNRMNPTTVAMTVQGQCQFLRQLFPERDDLTVVVANDVRVFNDNSGAYKFLGETHPLLGVSSRSLGKLACEIYAGNGINAYLIEPESDQAVLTTPELSFVIDRLGAVGGINLSASHNPPDDNGVKIYDQYGSQPVAPEDQRLVDTMAQVTEIKAVPFSQALAAGQIRDIPQDLLQEYVEAYVKLYDNIYPPVADFPITYTPLCGCGLNTVGRLLEHLGFPMIVPPDQKADGSFASIPFKAPNPEVAQAIKPACDFAAQNGSGIVLSSDPDVDRVGLDIQLADGSWYHFDGNQIGAILGYFLMLDKRGPQRRGLVIETLVTTKLIGKITEVAGDSWLVDDLLVGFKYVADVLKRLESGKGYKDIACSPEQLVLAAEESHGVIMLPSIRDKDAAPACLYLAALYQMLRQEGLTLLDYYVQILEELGGYDCVNRSIMMTGPEGMMKKNRIMQSLRESAPATLGGYPVNKAVDYWDTEAFGPFVSNTDRLPRDVFQIFTDSFIITVRPSGTEPKLKFYCQLLPQGAITTSKGTALLQEIREKAEQAAAKVYNELLQRIDATLNDAALLLPDIVDLGLKQHFDTETVPKLHDAIEQKVFNDLDDFFVWLRKETAAMFPGTDPLPALKAPTAYLCQHWAEEFSDISLLADINNWAKS